MNNYAKIIIRTDFHRKDGSSPICLRLTFNRKVKLVSLKKYVDPDLWNESKGLLKETDPESENTNKLLKSYLKRANDIIFAFEMQNKPLSFEGFQFEFKNERTDCFYSFVEREFENNVNTRINSESSLKGLKTDLSKLKKFKKSLIFDEISVPFLQSYEGYMRNKLKNEINTIHKSLKFIRTFLNRAIRHGVIKENIFKKYRLKTQPSKRNFLTEQEIKEVESLIEQPIPSYYKKYLKIFLFSCYTGLRYQDVKTLRYRNIENNIILIEMHKTKETVSIPLIERAKVLMGYGGRDELVFRVPTNQVINKYIKEALKATSIKKNISFHCSRHTFATHCITLGMPIEVISKILGHTDVKTTQIYTKVRDIVKVREMEKWNI